MAGRWGAEVYRSWTPPAFLQISPAPSMAAETPPTRERQPQSILPRNDDFCGWPPVTGNPRSPRGASEKAIPGFCRETTGPVASCSRASPGSSCTGWAAAGRVCPHPLPAGPPNAHAPSGLGEGRRQDTVKETRRKRERQILWFIGILGSFSTAKICLKSNESGRLFG